MKSLFSPQACSAARKPTFFYVGLLVTAAVVTALFSFLFSSFKYEYEEKAGSLIWSLLPEQKREERITIVAIDEQSLAEVGAWPWPRAVMADLSNKLAEYGSSKQLFDIVFPESKASDDALAKAIKDHQAVLAQVPIFDYQSSVKSGVLSGALNSTSCQYPIPATNSYLGNAASLNVQHSGHITPIVDQDGMIRKQPPLVCIDGRAYPSLALQGLLSSLNNHGNKVSINQDGSLLSAPWTLSIDSYFGLSIPLDDQGNMRISYRQSPNSFQVVSAASVLNGTAPEALLNGAWVLIGATAFGMGDIVPTPHSGMTPGVELQARLLSSLLDGKTPYSPTSASLILIIEAIACAFLLILVARCGGKIAALGLPIATFVLPFTAWAFHSYLLTFDIWLGWFNVAVFAFLSSALFVLAEHQLLRVQHLRVFSHLSSYLPKSVAESLIHTQPSGAIEAQRFDMVLMCADLRNFSAYEESRPPEEAAALLHYFFTEASAIIEEHNGQVEEYKGDSILASWKIESQGDASQSALDAANALQQRMCDILPKRPPKGLEPLALGIGIERGQTLVGSLGPSHRRHHTLLGDTVTIVLRIQEMTQDLAQPILMGECVARDITGDKLDSQGSFLLDGLTTPHVLFAPKSLRVDPILDLDSKRVVQLRKSS